MFRLERFDGIPVLAAAATLVTLLVVGAFGLTLVGGVRGSAVAAAVALLGLVATGVLYASRLSRPRAADRRTR